MESENIPMEIETETETENKQTLFEFPEPDPSRSMLSKKGDELTMKWIATPARGKKGKKKKSQDPFIDLKLMMAIASNPELNADLLGKMSALPLLPIPVYQSPMYCMLARKGNGGVKSRFTDSIVTIRNLALIMAYYQVVYPTIQKPNNDEENQRIVRIDKQFTSDLKIANDLLFMDLANIFKNDNNDANDEEKTVMVLNMLIQFTLYYIHLQERFLYRATIQPKNKTLKIGLGQVMTQLKTPPLDVLPKEHQENFLEAVMRFFATKDTTMNQMLFKTNCKEDVRDWFNVNVFKNRRQKYNGQLFAGWLDPETATEYMQFLGYQSQ
jgi:hypothetical protein